MWIKFCGLVRPDDLAYAVALGVDAVGVVAVPGTPRCVSLEEAELLSKVPRGSAVLTLVLQDPKPEYAANMIALVKPDLLQFHGSESPEFAEEFGLPHIKATRSLTETAISQLTQHQAAFAWLVDAANSETSEDMMLHVSYLHPVRRFIIAGGLSCQNVSQKIQQLQPWGIDVSRGIEKTPREKDHQLMKEFVHAARE